VRVETFFFAGNTPPWPRFNFPPPPFRGVAALPPQLTTILPSFWTTSLPPTHEYNHPSALFPPDKDLLFLEWITSQASIAGLGLSPLSWTGRVKVFSHISLFSGRGLRMPISFQRPRSAFLGGNSFFPPLSGKKPVPRRRSFTTSFSPAKALFPLNFDPDSPSSNFFSFFFSLLQKLQRSLF